jgi:hypothetical protein
MIRILLGGHDDSLAVGGKVRSFYRFFLSGVWKMPERISILCTNRIYSINRQTQCRSIFRFEKRPEYRIKPVNSKDKNSGTNWTLYYIRRVGGTKLYFFKIDITYMYKYHRYWSVFRKYFMKLAGKNLAGIENRGKTILD